MATTRCERHGQVEIGVIEHEGREFTAFGASVHGHEVTGYTKQDRHGIRLTTWCGKTMLDARSEVVERYWSGAVALMSRLPRGRFVVGYALGDDGMLFRGEMLDGGDDFEARTAARRLADCWSELDADDEASFQAELLDEG